MSVDAIVFLNLFMALVSLGLAVSVVTERE